MDPQAKCFFAYVYYKYSNFSKASMGGTAATIGLDDCYWWTFRENEYERLALVKE